MQPLKEPYNRPHFEVITLELEETIAVASSTVTIGEIGQPYQPDIEGWEEGNNGYGTGEF